MTRFIYATSTTLDGYLADEDNSLEWLFAVEGGDEALEELEEFTAGVAVMVEGSTTYEWVIEYEGLVANPEKWKGFYGDRKTFVFTSRSDLSQVPGADVEFVDGPVTEHEAAIVVAFFNAATAPSVETREMVHRELLLTPHPARPQP